MALGIWLLLVIVYDTALLGLLVADGGRFVTPGLFGALLLLNPSDAFRLLNLAGFADARLVAGLAGVDAGPAGQPGGGARRAGGLGAAAARAGRLAARQERDMKLRALLVLLVLAACDDAQQVAGPPPREPGPGDVGNYCGMVLVEHPGPKAQIFLASRAGPVVVHPGARRDRVHPTARGAARHHRHLGQRHGPHDQLASARGRRLGRSAQRLVRHRQQPGRRHGRRGSGPVRDRAARTGLRGGAWRPRRAPGRDPGRLRPGLDAAAGRTRRRARRSRPAHHERPARPPTAPDRRHRRRARPAGRRRPGDTRGHLALAGLGAGGRIRRSCWLIPTMRQPGRRSPPAARRSRGSSGSSACTGPIPRCRS